MILPELVLAALAQLPVALEPVNDERPDFRAAAWAGVAVDTFASGSVNALLNPEVQGAKTRGVGGFAFAYRAIGSAESRQLWVTAETHHGIRSADIDCTESPSFATCASSPTPPTGTDVLFLIREASTLEASLGVRWEFLTLRKGSDMPAKLYLVGNYGLVVAAEGPSDAADVGHIGLGLVATKGAYRDTFLEIGIGQNELFSSNQGGRFKARGGLSIHASRGMRFFAVLSVDTDLGPGADSVQSYYGFAVDPVRLFGGN